MTLEQILAKWEARIAPTLAEDYASVDLCDLAAAQAIKELILEIRQLANQPPMNTPTENDDENDDENRTRMGFRR